MGNTINQYRDEDITAIYAAVGNPPNITAAKVSTLSSITTGLPVTVPVTLTGGTDTAGGVGGLTLPASATLIIRVVADITHINTTGACTLDIGYTATGLTTLSDNLLDGIDVHSGVAVFDNMLAANAGTNGLTCIKAAASKFITVSTVAGGASAGLTGVLYVTYLVIPIV